MNPTGFLGIRGIWGGGRLTASEVSRVVPDGLEKVPNIKKLEQV